MAKYKATTVVYFSYLLEADSEQQAEQQARELAEEGIGTIGFIILSIPTWR